jgi:hypothetical protein
MQVVELRRQRNELTERNVVLEAQREDLLARLAAAQDAANALRGAADRVAVVAAATTEECEATQHTLQQTQRATIRLLADVRPLPATPTTGGRTPCYARSTAPARTQCLFVAPALQRFAVGMLCSTAR